MTPPTPAPDALPPPGPGGAAIPLAHPPEPASLPRWRLVAAIALPVTAIIAIVVLAAVINARPVADVADPLAVSSVEAPDATSAACTTLMTALPDPLGQLPRRELIQGDDPLLTGVAAWGEPAVILRCGTPTPQELTCSAAVQVVDGVTWLPLYGSDVTTYLAVDRPVRVALTIPDGTSTGPWQEMSKIIGATLTQRPICVDGLPATPDGG